MIIVLKGADFSANNIGKVDVSSVLSDRTKKIVARFSKNLSDYTQFALQELIDWLDSEGILSNMDALYLPCLAGTLEEAFVNVAKSPFNTDIVLDSEIFELKSNGVRVKSSGVTNKGIQLTCTAPVKDMHLLWYNTEEYAKVLDIVYPIGGTNNFSFSPGEKDKEFTGGTPQCELGGYNIGTLSGGRMNNSGIVTAGKSLKGINHKDIDSLNGLKMYSPGMTMTKFNNEINYASMTNSMGAFNISGINNNAMLIPHGVFSLGRGLTDVQVIQYNEKINKLMTTL